MEPISMDVSVEEREEGEIIDDLEDVSDCSMSPGSPLYSGKSVSPPELLSAVCLSSISTSEYSTTDGRTCIYDPSSFRHHDPRSEVIRHRGYTKRRRQSEDYNSKRTSKRNRNHHHHHHTRRSIETTETDSENEIVDPKYAKKLRVALRRESSQDLLHNSLRTRLKAFIDPDSQSEDDLSLAALRDLAFATIKNSETNESDKQEEPNNLESKTDNPQNDNAEIVKDNLDENEMISDIELEGVCELEEIPIILDSTDNKIDKEKNEDDSSDDKSTKTVGENNKVPEIIGDDSELNELRLAALRTVIIEKHKRRKKKVAALVENTNDEFEDVNKSDINDTDKENDKSMINNDLDSKTNNNNKNCDVQKGNEILESKEPPVDNLTDIDDKNADEANYSDSVRKVEIEEDADILRAMLLASMSNKIANPVPENSDSPPPLVGSLIRKVEKSKINCNSITVTISKPQPLLRTIKNDIYRPNSNNLLKINKINEQPQYIVKPLIINVNDDSDSDTENTSNETNQSLKDTVTEFLKKQRAEVEAGKAQLSEHSLETSLNKSDDVLTEKSVVKLLPHSQQIEYRRLKQLLNARKRTRIRRLSHRLSESKREKVPKTKTDVSMTNVSENTKTISTNVAEKSTVQSSTKTVTSSNNLQKTLSDLQIRKNGRLQMKGKYRSLAPFLSRIHQTSNERQQHQIEIKKLLQQIETARVKLAASHQNFTILVHQLLSEKNKIDKRVFNKVVKPLPFNNNIFTSTPNKFIKKMPTVNVSSPNKLNTNSGIVATESNNTVAAGMKKEADNNEINRLEQVNDVKKELDDSKVEQEEVVLLDPNDVDKVFVEQPLVEMATFPKYTSPLDNRDGINDPLTTVCPYDLLGVCKDKECRYVHCS